MISKVENILSEQIPDYRNCKFLLAVSGGVDSMVMLHTFKALNLSFCVAHCNFLLRDEESESETNFVIDYCNTNNIEYFVKYFKTEEYSHLYKVSIQIAARELRYQWFNELLRENNINYLITAHHLNDQIETYFINSLRATSVNGLTGIPEKSNNIFRPFLNFSRHEIESFAKQSNVLWKEDSSNASTKYVRNKIRHKIVPILEEMSPDLYQNFRSLFQYLKEDLLLKEEFIQELNVKYVTEKADSFEIDLISLLNTKNYFIKLKQLLNRFGFNNDNEIKKIIQSQTGSCFFSKDYQLLKNRGILIIRSLKVNNIQEDEIFIKNDATKGIISIIFGNKNLNPILNFTNLIEVNSDLLIEPLIVRNPKEGDYFYPLGMNGKKKISKYLKDLKLSQFEKEKVKVLENGNKEIIWVIGGQMDNRYKTNQETTKTIKIITND